MEMTEYANVADQISRLAAENAALRQEAADYKQLHSEAQESILRKMDETKRAEDMCRVVRGKFSAQEASVATLKARCKALEDALIFEQGVIRDFTRTVLQHNGAPTFLVAVATERRNQLQERTKPFPRAARKAMDQKEAIGE